MWEVERFKATQHSVMQRLQWSLQGRLLYLWNPNTVSHRGDDSRYSVIGNLCRRFMQCLQHSTESLHPVAKAQSRLKREAVSLRFQDVKGIPTFLWSITAAFMAIMASAKFARNNRCFIFQYFFRHKWNRGGFRGFVSFLKGMTTSQFIEQLVDLNRQPSKYKRQCSIRVKMLENMFELGASYLLRWPARHSGTQQ